MKKISRKRALEMSQKILCRAERERRGSNAKIMHYYGVLVTGDVLMYESTIEMPCGFTVSSPSSGWPRRDIPCPCGDNSHTVIAFK